MGLKRLLDTGTWELRGRFLVWPKFIEVQTATRSDKARQQESRERRRAMAHASEVLGEPGAGVTKRDEVSRGVTAPPQNVTDGHGRSQPVTLSLAEPNSTDPSQHTDARVGEPSEVQAKASAYVRDPNRTALEHGPVEKWPEVVAAAEVFEAEWPGSGSLRSRDSRALVIVERYAQGFTLDDLRDAAEGAKRDPHIASNPTFQTIKTVWRDEGQIDRFRKLLTSPGVSKTHRQPSTGAVSAEEYMPR
jgi:hypothetical protein